MGKKHLLPMPERQVFFLFFANLNPEHGYKGITAFLVEKEMEGFSIGRHEKKLGICAAVPVK